MTNKIKIFNFDYLNPCFLFTAYFFCFSFLKFIFLKFGLYDHRLFNFRTTNFVFTLVFLVFIFTIITFLHTRKIKFKFNFLSKILNFSYSAESIKLLSFFLLPIIILLYEIYFRSVNHSFLVFNVEPVKVKLLGGKNPISFIFIKGIAQMLLMLWMYVLFYSSIVYRNNYVSLFIYILVTIYISFITGTRSFLIMSTLIPFIFCYNCFRRKITIVYLISISFISLTLISIMGILRMNQVSNFHYSQLLDNNVFELVFRLIDRRFDSIYPNLCIAFDLNPEFRYGYDFILMPLQFIPRFFFSDKPFTFVRDLNNSLSIIAEGGVGFSPILEFWFNFHIIGIALLSIIVSFIFAYFGKLYIFAKRSNNVFLLCFVNTVGWPLIHTFTIAPGITHNTPTHILKIFIFFISLFIIKLLHSAITIYFNK